MFGPKVVFDVMHLEGTQ